MSDNEQLAFSRLTDPETSREAAERVDVSKLDRLILGRLQSLANDPRRGETTLELSRALNQARVSISPRMRPLANNGKAHDTGVRRHGIVWGYGPDPNPEPPGKHRYKLSRRNVARVIDAAAKARDLLEGKPQLTFDEQTILNDHLNPALEAIGRPSRSNSDGSSNRRGTPTRPE